MSLIGAAIGVGASLIGNKKKKNAAEDAAAANSAAQGYSRQAIDSLNQGYNQARQDLSFYDDAINQSQKGFADAAASAGKGISAIQSGITNLDKLKPVIEEFASKGQDNFDKYQQMMGPMEATLNDYYTNLDADELAAQSNQSAQQQYQNAMNQVNDQLASQGIANSGMAAQMAMGQGAQMAQTKAQNILDSPHQVAQQQSGWMDYMAGQGNQAFNQMAQGVGAQQQLGNSYMNAYNNMANVYGNIGQIQSQGASSLGNLNASKANAYSQLGQNQANALSNAYSGHAAQNVNMANAHTQQGNQALESGMQLGGYLYENTPSFDDWSF